MILQQEVLKHTIKTLSIVDRRTCNTEMVFLLNDPELSIAGHEEVMVFLFIERDIILFCRHPQSSMK